MTKKIIGIEHRLHELARRLEKRGLKFPESETAPGLPHYAEIARMVDASPSSLGNSHGSPSVGRLKIMEHVANIGLMPFNEFAIARDSDPDLRVERDTLDESMVVLLLWVQSSREASLAVPESPGRPGFPYFALIGRVRDLDPNRLAHPKMPYRMVIEDAAEDMGLMNSEEFVKATTPTKGLTRASKVQLRRLNQVEAFLATEHVKPEKPLPESRHKRGRPFYSAICKSAGCQFKGGPLEREIVNLIDSAAQMVGIGSDGFRPPLNPSSLIHEEVTNLCLQRMKFDDQAISKSVTARFKSSIRKWQSSLGKMETDRIDDDFGDGYEENLGRIGGTIANKDSRRHWLNDMSRCYAFLSTLATEMSDDLPPDFAGALSLLVRRGGFKSHAEFCRMAGVSDHHIAIRHWVRGLREPVRPDRTLVYKLEDYFDLERDTLARRIRAEIRPSTGELRVSTWPPSLNTEKLKRLAKPLLPADWAHLSDSKREEIGRSIREDAQTSNAFRLKMQKPKIRHLRPIPDQITEEWEELVEYKTALIPDLARASTWSEGTISRYWNEISLYLTALSNDPAQGGLGIKPENLTLAFLACPKILRWYIHWQFDRLGGQFNTGARTWLGIISHLTTLTTSDLSGNITEIPGFLQSVS